MTLKKESLKVLFLDDSMDDVTLLVYELGKHYKLIWERVESTASLIVALDTNWDIIICDYRMPTLGAEQALSTIRSDIRHLTTPIIVVSGVVDETVAIELLKKGAQDFISKDRMPRLIFAVKREVTQSRERKEDVLRSEIRIKESYEKTIEAWGKALELRDHYTVGHTRRVTDLSLRLARHMNVTYDEFVILNRGALLHDVGKMGIPDAVLLKQDILTHEEMEIMKQHPVLAYQMLDGIPFLKPCIDIPYLHHERWNGTGYPLGLEADKIPFLVRLFSIIDVYDALTSDRPYRASWEKSKVIAYLIEERSHTFDPIIVDAFVNMIGRA